MLPIFRREAYQQNNKYMLRLLYILLLYLVSITASFASDVKSYGVITFNIRYDNKDDVPHDWISRRDSLSRVILSYKADIIGMQEVLHNQRNYLTEQLKTYRMLGVGRLDGKTEGEYAPIWYLESRFALVNSGHFWLSESPNSIGKRGWDAACERIATWAILRDKEQGGELFVLNTHLDHEGLIAREESTKLILNFITQRSGGRPVILMGDFNASPEDKVVKNFLSPKSTLILKDSYSYRNAMSGASGTFHNFGKLPFASRERIDYILVSPQFTVEQYKTIRTDGPALCLSDHNGIYTRLVIDQRPALTPSTQLRPEPSKRKYTSIAADKLVSELKSRYKPKVQGDTLMTQLAWLFEHCYPNTLDTTIESYKLEKGKPYTFVITGDIYAMWLRDSGAQVSPYLPLIGKDKALAQLIAGVINQQVKYILIDPYANAYNDKPISSYWVTKDKTEWMHPMLHERKWELDSHCYPIRLSHAYWRATGDTSIFDKDWKRAAHTILNTMQEQQRVHDLGPYTFQRKDDRPTDSQINNGYGHPAKACGLIASAFRPSDDATQYPYHIPSNMFAVVSLRQLAEIMTEVYQDKALSTRALTIAEEVDKAIQTHGIGTHPTAGKIYAYEVDGYGNMLFMDDANVPSLLSAPYLGYCTSSDPIYQRTRRFVWSESNPYFFRGRIAEGIGGPHVGLGQAWPMSIIMRGLTTEDPQELRDCAQLLLRTHGNTGYMHESFDVDNPNKYTRAWFAWANSLFGEFVLHYERNLMTGNNQKQNK